MGGLEGYLTVAKREEGRDNIAKDDVLVWHRCWARLTQEGIHMYSANHPEGCAQDLKGRIPYKGVILNDQVELDHFSFGFGITTVNKKEETITEYIFVPDNEGEYKRWMSVLQSLTKENTNNDESAKQIASFDNGPSDELGVMETKSAQVRGLVAETKRRMADLENRISALEIQKVLGKEAATDLAAGFRKLKVSNESRINNYKYKGYTPEKLREDRHMEVIELRHDSRYNKFTAGRDVEKDVKEKAKLNSVINPNDVTNKDYLNAPSVNASGMSPNELTAELQAAGEVIGQFSDIAEVRKNPGRLLTSVVIVRKLLSRELNPPIKETIELNLIPFFVKYLQMEEYTNLQFEAAWVLTNISSGTSEHTKKVVEAGSVPMFVKLLSSAHKEVAEQSVWALGNIAGDSTANRDFVLHNNCMPSMLALIQKFQNQDPPISLMRNCTWTLSNLCRGKPSPDHAQVRAAIPVLASLSHSADEEVLVDACWALSYVSDGGNDRIQSVIESGVTRRLVELLLHAQKKVQIPALRTIGNLATGDDMQTQIVLNSGALQALNVLLDCDHVRIRKEACWTISNITAGNRQQIARVLESGIIPKVKGLLTHHDLGLRKEAVWAICNLLSGGSVAQIELAVNFGILESFSLLLKEPVDDRLLIVCLQGLRDMCAQPRGVEMLRDADLDDDLEKIESLNNEVGQLVADIMRRIDEDDNEND